MFTSKFITLSICGVSQGDIFSLNGSQSVSQSVSEHGKVLAKGVQLVWTSRIWSLKSQVSGLRYEVWALKSEIWSLRSEDWPVCLFLLMFDNLTAGPETGASSSPMSQISIVFTGGRHENPAGSLNEIPIITATQKWVDKICLIRVLRQDIRERRGEESHNLSQIYPLIAGLSDRPRHGTLIT